MNIIMENFATILTLAVLICLIGYVLDGMSYRKTRKHLMKVFTAQTETDADRNAYADRLLAAYDGKVKKSMEATMLSAQNKLNAREHLSGSELYWAKRPVYPRERIYEFFGGMFWVLFVVWFVRSFLWEPFQIPSASMEPTLQNGDFILTSKYAYGIRLPITNTKIIPIGEVQRGDVVVFHYPKNPKIDYIKRIVGLPGDHIVVDHGRLTVNGEKVAYENLNIVHHGHDNHMPYDVYQEALPGKTHRVQFAQNTQINDYIFASSTYHDFTVPEHSYFAMGDDRDNSEDSRFWGFVPEKNLVGKALFIWMNSDCITLKGYCSRIGQGIK